MKQNVASQTIGAQLVSATDGSAVTSGTTTVAVTIDGGTQGAGAGTVAHEGNGYWSYAPTQAETNGAHIAFTFTNSSAVPVTVQVYTTFPQTGDSFARLGAPAGASVSADIATIDGNVDAILVDTGTTLDGKINTIDTEVAAIKAVTDNLPDSGALTSIATALETVDANVDAILVDTGTTLDGKINTIDTVVDAIKVQTDKLTFTVANQVDANMQSINDAALAGDGTQGNEFTVA